MPSWRVLGDDTRPASHESPLQRLLWLHNQVSVFVLLTVQVLTLLLVDHAALAERYRPFLGRVSLGPIAVMAVELLLWHFLYRRGGTEARWAAGLMGVFFVLLILIQLARASIDVPLDPWSMLLAAYMAASHLSYASLGSRARH